MAHVRRSLQERQTGQQLSPLEHRQAEVDHRVPGMRPSQRSGRLGKQGPERQRRSPGDFRDARLSVSKQRAIRSHQRQAASQPARLGQRRPGAVGQAGAKTSQHDDRTQRPRVHRRAGVSGQQRRSRQHGPPDDGRLRENARRREGVYATAGVPARQ